MKTIDILHRTFVTGCMATTLYFSGFLVVRYRDIRRKANELEEFAAREKLTYPEAAAQMGYAPIPEDSPWLKAKEAKEKEARDRATALAGK